MATEYVQPGIHPDYEAAVDTNIGEVVAIGTKAAVVNPEGQGEAVLVSGKTGSVAVEGVFDFDQNATPIAYTRGDRVFFDLTTQTVAAGPASATVLDAGYVVNDVAATAGGKVRTVLGL